MSYCELKEQIRKWLKLKFLFTQDKSKAVETQFFIQFDKSKLLILSVWCENDVSIKLFPIFLPSCNVSPIHTARSPGAGRLLGRPARAKVDAWCRFLEGTEMIRPLQLKARLVFVRRVLTAANALSSAADDQGGSVVLWLVRGSKQSPHADSPHHVPK